MAPPGAFFKCGVVLLIDPVLEPLSEEARHPESMAPSDLNTPEESELLSDSTITEMQNNNKLIYIQCFYKIYFWMFLNISTWYIWRAAGQSDVTAKTIEAFEWLSRIRFSPQ